MRTDRVNAVDAAPNRLESSAMDESLATEPPPPGLEAPRRIDSIDALRGFVMFAMIFVNDLSGAGSQVPDWLVHYSDRHPEGSSGLTFVDLVFPAFLFVMGMSIPFAFTSRWSRGERLWTTVFHVLVRTLSLLAIGILMVNDESPARPISGWSPTLWAACLYPAATLAFGSWLAPKGAEGLSTKICRWVTIGLRLLGMAALVVLAWNFRGAKGVRIVTLAPFSIHTDWYGILGLIGWAYLVASLVFLLFRGHRTALLGVTTLLYGLYIADRSGTFEGLTVAKYVSIGETLGSQAAIATTGLLLAATLGASGLPSALSRLNFAAWLMVWCAIGAFLLEKAYGISKNDATPSWCLLACVSTIALWLIFHWLADVGPWKILAKPWSLAGQNVLLAYLLSEWWPSLAEVCHLGRWYDGLAAPSLTAALIRAASCALVIQLLSVGINRAGFKVRL